MTSPKRKIGFLPILIAIVTGLFSLALVATIVSRVTDREAPVKSHTLGETVDISGSRYTFSDPQWLSPPEEMLEHYRENSYAYQHYGVDPLFLTVQVDAECLDPERRWDAPTYVRLSMPYGEGYFLYFGNEYESDDLPQWAELTGLPLTSLSGLLDGEAVSGRLLFVIDPDVTRTGTALLSLSEYGENFWRGYHEVAEHQFSFTLPETGGAE